LADLEELSVYIRYHTLFAADFRSLLDGIERAYNQMDCFLRERSRVHPGDRLFVKSIHTGNSLELVLNGPGAVIVALGYLLHIVLKERGLYWQGEKTKWEAKSAEIKFRQEKNQEIERRIREGRLKENRKLIRAEDSIQKLSRQIARSPHIASVEIKFVADEDQPAAETPRRQILFEDD